VNYKQIPEEELKKELSEFKFKTEPRYHQLVSLKFAKDSDGRVAFLHSIGSGKSILGLYSAQIWDCKKILVVCPTSVISTWEDECKKHTDWKYTILMGTTSERRHKLTHLSSKLNICNWAGLRYLFCEKRNKKFVPSPELLANLDIDCLILDEAHKIGNSLSLQTRVCNFLSRIAGNCILLTGSPISNNELNLWSLYYVLNQGRSLGNNFFSFRNKYFKSIRCGNWRKHWVEWKLKTKEHSEQILDKIAPVTLHYSRAECCSLPDVTYMRREIELSRKQKEVIATIRGEIESEYEVEKIIGSSIRNKAIKIVQIAGGTLLRQDKPTFIFSPNPKLNELKEILLEMDEKAIIFHSFVEEGREIEKMCKKQGWEYRSLRSEIKNKSKNIRDFQNDPEIKILIAHPSSGGEGLNLQCARVCIFYSNGFTGYLLREQAEGRIYRAGQDKNCVFIDIIARDSLDEHILEVQRSKKKIANAILAYLGKG